MRMMQNERMVDSLLEIKKIILIMRGMVEILKLKISKFIT
jgi:hypothetical protein